MKHLPIALALALALTACASQSPSDSNSSTADTTENSSLIQEEEDLGMKIMIKLDGYTVRLPEDMAFYPTLVPHLRIFTKNVPVEGDFTLPITWDTHYFSIDVTTGSKQEAKDIISQMQNEVLAVATQEGKSPEEVMTFSEFQEFTTKSGDVFEYAIMESVGVLDHTANTHSLLFASEQAYFWIDATYETKEQIPAIEETIFDYMKQITISPEGLQDSDLFSGQAEEGFPVFYKIGEDGTESALEIPSFAEKDSIDPDFAPFIVFKEDLLTES